MTSHTSHFYIVTHTVLYPFSSSMRLTFYCDVIYERPFRNCMLKCFQNIFQNSVLTLPIAVNSFVLKSFDVIVIIVLYVGLLHDGCWCSLLTKQNCFQRNGNLIFVFPLPPVHCNDMHEFNFKRRKGVDQKHFAKKKSKSDKKISGERKK